MLSMPPPAHELNTHFSSISSDPSAFSVSKFLEGVADEDSFPHFSFSEVTLSEVKLAMKRSEFILDIFNKSIRESVFPSIWKKSLVLALNKQHLILSAISGLLRCYASYRKSLRGEFIIRCMIILKQKSCLILISLVIGKVTAPSQLS